MIHKLIGPLVAASVLLQTGCCSYMVADGSAKRVNERRAIQVREMNGTPVVAVDLLSMDTLAERPLLQLGAALLDAGLVWGGYKAYRAVNENDADSDKQDINITITQGANSRVNVQPGASGSYTEGQGFNSFE